jgi:hypothetical protein
MVARLITAVLALVIAGGPVITAACQALCAERADDNPTTKHHSCHHQQPASTGAAIDSLPHLCGHLDEGPSAVGQAIWSLTAPAVIESPVALTPATPDTLQAPGADNGLSPPLLSSRLTPLRI